MRNYNEYEISIDPSQELSLDSLDQKLPDLGPMSLPILDLTKLCPVTNCGLISQKQLEQDFNSITHQDTPLLDNFYEDEAIRQQRIAREKAKVAQRREKRAPVYREPQKARKKSVESGYGSASDKSSEKAPAQRRPSIGSSTEEEDRQDRDQAEADAKFDEANEDAVDRQKEADESNRLKQEEADARTKEREEQERKEKEREQERKQKEQEQKRREKEEADQKAKDEAERKQKEEEDKMAQDEAEKKRKEEEAQKPEEKLDLEEQAEDEPKSYEDQERQRQADIERRNGGKNIITSTRNVFFQRHHILTAELETDDGSWTKDSIDLNEIVSHNGRELSWGNGSGYMRNATRASIEGTDLWVEVQSGWWRNWLRLPHIHEHILNRNGRFGFSAQPLRWD